MKEMQEKVIEIARLIRDGKGVDTVAIDISELNSWTDYFVITTINSGAHWQGLCRQIMEYAQANDLDSRKNSKRMATNSDDWNLIDLGSIVVHLMSSQAREFYDLEKLWHAGKQIEF